MTYNYHTHTFRCGHASGTEREYIERAIENGITVMGFSDHSPYRFPDGREANYRVKTDTAEDYFVVLRQLREEYKDRIDIKIGFEMEYYDLYFEDMLSYVCGLGTEYLILGQHLTNNDTPGIRHVCSRPTDSEEQLEAYTDAVVEGMATGAFSYVAHPDVFNFTGSEEKYEKEMRRLCKQAAKLDLPLEINFLGIRGGRHYPTDLFWRIAGEEGCTAIYGFDAHDVPASFDGDSIPAAEALRAKYNIPLISPDEFRLLDPTSVLEKLRKENK